MTKTTKRRRSIGVYVAVGLVALLALVAAVVLSSGGEDVATMPADAQVIISGSSLPTFEGDPNSDPGIGLAAPDLSGQDFEGRAVAITADGRPKVIVFLAHWCPACQQEVPTVQTYADETGFPDSVDFFSVATLYNPSRPNWPPSEWLAQEGWTLPVIVDDPQSTAYQAFGQGALPYFVFIDSAGQVALRLVGAQDPAVLADIMSQLADL